MKESKQSMLFFGTPVCAVDDNRLQTINAIIKSDFLSKKNDR